jgi:hypothetical protein
MKTIGFFGDSFCATKGAGTWLDQLANHYDAKATHYGVVGSSAGDAIVNQFGTEQKRGKTPDIAVFVWTNSARLFHPHVRNITPERALSPLRDVKDHVPLWNAARDYYLHIYDQKHHELLFLSLIHYFDKMVLPDLPNMKVVHLWAFADGGKGNIPTTYPYTFTSGVEVRPALVNIAREGREHKDDFVDTSPNHMDTEEKNTRVFNMVREAIDAQ